VKHAQQAIPSPLIGTDNGRLAAVVLVEEGRSIYLVSRHLTAVFLFVCLMLGLAIRGLLPDRPSGKLWILAEPRLSELYKSPDEYEVCAPRAFWHG